jgi:IS1 family transposase
MGRWSGSCRGSIQRRHGHIMQELARDMRQLRTFTSSAAMYEYTVG